MKCLEAICGVLIERLFWIKDQADDGLRFFGFWLQDDGLWMMAF